MFPFNDNVTKILLFIFMGGILFLYISPNAIQFNYVTALQNNENETNQIISVLPHHWTWTCNNNRCSRSEATNNETPKSLKTCSMICGDDIIWPKPKRTKIRSATYSSISITKDSFNIEAPKEVKEYLAKYQNIFLNNILEIKKQNTNNETHLRDLYINIVVHDNVVSFKQDVNESYAINITNKSNKIFVQIEATTYLGSVHALETLFQLIWWDQDLKILDSVEIEDAPSFSYRGLMVDTARHFIGIPTLKKIVDGMVTTKLNVLHLHVTDQQSFPIELPSLPPLANYGLYEKGMYFTPKDIEELVEYAKIRAVKLILEIDAPSHFSSDWNLNSLNQSLVQCNQLNPDNDLSLYYMQVVYQDLLKLQQHSDYFHIGGDEVDLNCWKDTQAAAKFKGRMMDLWIDYINKLLEKLVVANNGTSPDYVFLWSSPLTDSAVLNNIIHKENLVVQYWFHNANAILDKEFKILYSTVGSWYLDCGYGPWKSSETNPSCSPLTHWKKFYTYAPWKFQPSSIKQTLGGEVCLWNELQGEANAETMIWPRAAAFAERVWSDPSSFDPVVVQKRLDSFISVLESKSVKVTPLWPKWCSRNPGECN